MYDKTTSLNRNDEGWRRKNKKQPKQAYRKNFHDLEKLHTQTSSATKAGDWTKRRAFSNPVSCHQKSEYHTVMQNGQRKENENTFYPSKDKYRQGACQWSSVFKVLGDGAGHIKGYQFDFREATGEGRMKETGCEEFFFLEDTEI